MYSLLVVVLALSSVANALHPAAASDIFRTPDTSQALLIIICILLAFRVIFAYTNRLYTDKKSS